jgi:hypothetical protein
MAKMLLGFRRLGWLAARGHFADNPMRERLIRALLAFDGELERAFGVPGASAVRPCNRFASASHPVQSDTQGLDIAHDVEPFLEERNTPLGRPARA